MPGCQKALEALKDHQVLLTGKDRLKRSREEAQRNIELWDKLYETLCCAPEEYSGMVLDITFLQEDVDGEEAWNNFQIIESIGIQPYSVENGRSYRLQLYVNRLTDWTKSGFSKEEITHAGSPVRNYIQKNPPQISLSNCSERRDWKTRQQEALRVTPRLNPWQENFYVFPRNINSITLTETLPSYDVRPEVFVI